MNPLKKYFHPDVIGIISASVCMIHCIALPMLMLTSMHIFSHPLMEIFFLSTSAISIYYSTKGRNITISSLLLWISFTGLCISTLLHDHFAVMKMIGYAFSVLIIIGHIIQMRTCPKCR
jgi:hypothetical protein